MVPTDDTTASARQPTARADNGTGVDATKPDHPLTDATTPADATPTATGEFSRRAALGSLVAAAGLAGAASAAAQPQPDSPTATDTGAGEQVQQHPGRPPLPHRIIDAENLVIGSGYGAAVVAHRITEAGRPVRMVEMGAMWDKPGADGAVFSSFRKPDDRSMWFNRRPAAPLSEWLGVDTGKPIGFGPGVLASDQLGEAVVLSGRGFGGGSLVSSAMMVRPTKEMLQRQLPAVDADSLVGDFFPRAERMLAPKPISQQQLDAAEYYVYTRTGLADAKAVGLPTSLVPSVYDFGHLAAEAAGDKPKSALAGQLVYGNDHGKKTLVDNYLKAASASGKMAVDVMTRVDFVRKDGPGYLVVATKLGRDGSEQGQVAYRARRVFLGAGSTGSVGILLRSVAEGHVRGISPKLGARWGLNGTVLAGRKNHLWRPTGAGQSLAPVAAIDTRSEADKVWAALEMVPTANDLFTQLYGAVADNPNSGVLSLVAGQLTSDWDRSYSDPAVTAVRSVLDRLNRKLGTSFQGGMFDDGQTFDGTTTHHPLGGAVLGDVCDDFGRVNGAQGLYVTDGALIPGAIGVPPALTITALAERLMAELLPKDMVS